MTATAARIRVLCVDDHRIVLDGLTLLINRQPDMEVVGCASNGEQAIALFRELQPDVTLMDLQLPGISGLQAIQTIRSEFPDARVIVLTMYQGDEDIFRSLEAGAVTYLLKDMLSADLVRVVREVHQGGRPLAPTVASILASRSTQTPLTTRETEVVRLIAKGLRNKEIAMTLGIADETAKVHVKNILAKLNVSDRSAAITMALRRGIIHID